MSQPEKTGECRLTGSGYMLAFVSSSTKVFDILWSDRRLPTPPWPTNVNLFPGPTVVSQPAREWDA